MNYFIKYLTLLTLCSISFGQSVIDLTNNGTDVKTNCRAEIVESIPIGLTFNSSVVSKSTFDGLMSLISSARHTIDIASYYWTLEGTDVMPDPDPSSLEGKQLLNALIASKSRTDIRIRIAVNPDGSESENSTDLQRLAAVADIRRVNFTRLVGAGILHTKFVIVDDQHFYVGSANMDWRSLTQVKELGTLVTDCQPLANDLKKIFEVYWRLGEPNATIPDIWPKELSTEYNRSNPMSVSFNDFQYQVFLSSSPKSFCPLGRTNDIDAILSVIKSAKKYINIAVMDYFPQYLYSNNYDFWPVIDDALKEAAINRKVRVRLLASRWNHTRNSMISFLKSLSAFNDTKLFGADIQVKRFVVPSFTPSQQLIPFARVNHNKYMVTDETAYIGTSNWSADYFVSTGGVGIVVTPEQNGSNIRDIRDRLEAIFERDWQSSYASSV